MIGAQRAADLVSKMLAYSGGGRVVAERGGLHAQVMEMIDLLSASVARQLRRWSPAFASQSNDQPRQANSPSDGSREASDQSPSTPQQPKPPSGVHLFTPA